MYGLTDDDGRVDGAGEVVRTDADGAGEVVRTDADGAGEVVRTDADEAGDGGPTDADGAGEVVRTDADGAGDDGPTDAGAAATVPGSNGEADPRAGERPPARVGEGLLDEGMGPSSALAHLYRGELHRTKFWRERLDRTTNWAVVVMAAVLTWAFSNASHPHYVILVGGLAVGLFLFVEARRYRAYDIWRGRIRSLQRNVWAPGLDPDRGPASETWRRDLADDYAEPTVKIGLEEALAHRLRRVYLPLFGVLALAWVLRVTAFAGATWPTSARIGALPGTIVTGLVAAVVAAAVVVAVRPRTWRASDELRTEAIREER